MDQLQFSKRNICSRCKEFSVTQQGLQKAFNEHYIRTPGQEIRYRRAKAVANLLECTDATLNEIAKNCGTILLIHYKRI